MSLLAAVMVAAAVTGCSSSEADSPDTGFVRQERGSALDLPDVDAVTGNRLELGISWAGAALLPAEGTTTCRHVTDPRAGGEHWDYEVSTSDFADYDGGGEFPGRDFAVRAYLGTWTENGGRTDAVHIQFSGPGGSHHRMGGTREEGLSIAVSADHTALAFMINSLATSIDREPRWTAAAGTILCDAIEEVASGA
ncbi:hypothetical protein [Rhodococcus sp. OK519]|uniref:hypothetical protein n=1 Tax=Rhodococcus sp. OK519 TaxID=2135729 RepID=UPI002158FE2E